MGRHIGRRQLFNFVCLFVLFNVIFLVIQPNAQAQLNFAGDWDVDGSVKLCAKVKGSPRSCQPLDFSACFQATEDGELISEGIVLGTWAKKRGRRVRGRFDRSLLDTACGDLGAGSCDFRIRKARIIAKFRLGDDDNFRGKIKFAGRALLDGQSFRFTLKGKVTGTRRTGACPAGIP